MSAFNPGQNGDLRSEYLPAAVLEMAVLLRKEELKIPADTRPDNITITSDFNAALLTITATFPITTAVLADGSVNIKASEYLGAFEQDGGVTAAFNDGGGTLNANSKTKAFLEVCQLLQAAELQLPADTRPDNITISYDTEAGTASVTASLPQNTMVSTTGDIRVSAFDYL